MCYEACPWETMPPSLIELEHMVLQREGLRGLKSPGRGGDHNDRRWRWEEQKRHLRYEAALTALRVLGAAV